MSGRKLVHVFKMCSFSFSWLHCPSAQENRNSTGFAILEFYCFILKSVGWGPDGDAVAINSNFNRGNEHQLLLTNEIQHSLVDKCH
jgi:hypothetical protein